MRKLLVLLFVGVVIYLLFPTSPPVQHTVVGTTPPDLLPSGVKSRQVSFNHTHRFAIHDDHLWCQPLDGGEWKPIPLTQGRPVGVYAGGANLAVVMASGEMHYKKIIDEARLPEHEMQYSWQDCAAQPNWEPHWFGLPYVSKPYNSLAGSFLQIPSGSKAIAMSHLGQYAYDCADAHGRLHWVDVGATTLFVLGSDGRTIRAFDPWVPPYVSVELPVWESPTATYYAEGLGADASTLLTIGYRANADGSKQVALYSIDWDIDYAGWHPTRDYGYFEDPAHPNTRTLPMPSWVEQPLPPGKTLTEIVSVVQMGRGPGAREFRVEGIDGEGRVGYYAKSVAGADWEFHPEERELIGEKKLDPTTFPQTHAPRIATWRGEIGNGLTAELRDFGPHSHRATLVITKGGETVREFLVYRRLNLIAAGLGGSGVTFDIVAAHGTSSLLGGNREASVTVSPSGDAVRIKSTWTSWWQGVRGLDWTLNRQA